MFKKLIVIILVVIALAAYLGFKNTDKYKGPEGVACTMEAKLCPDGSAVGRTGPNCEFAPCPNQ